MFVFKVNKKITFFIILLIAIILLNLFMPIIFSSTPAQSYVVVIDAGHGGLDGGSQGVVTDNYESDLNLAYSKCLKEYFENFDFKVVLTRSTKEGLYSSFATNKKKSEMQAREKIIKETNPDIVISIHMNSYPLSSLKGSQVFYKDNDANSSALAESIQKQFIKDLPNARKSALVGDYYILNCSDCASVIVECGFLSNPDEDRLLGTKEYMSDLCYSIFCGVISYLGADSI